MPTLHIDAVEVNGNYKPINGATVPDNYSDTYNKQEVHRKSFEELRATAFNADQNKVLNILINGGGSGGGSPVAPLILQKEQDDTDPQETVIYIPTPFSTIKDAFLSGRMVLLDPVDNGKTYSMMIGMNVKQQGGVLGFANNETYTATSDSEYPILNPQ